MQCNANTWQSNFKKENEKNAMFARITNTTTKKTKRNDSKSDESLVAVSLCYAASRFLFLDSYCFSFFQFSQHTEENHHKSKKQNKKNLQNCCYCLLLWVYWRKKKLRFSNRAANNWYTDDDRTNERTEHWTCIRFSFICALANIFDGRISFFFLFIFILFFMHV